MNFADRVPMGTATPTSFFEATLDAMPHAVVVCEVDGPLIVYANAQATKELRLRRPEVVAEAGSVTGESIDAFLPGVIAESRAILELDGSAQERPVRLIGRTLDISAKRLTGNSEYANHLIVSWSTKSDQGSPPWYEKLVPLERNENSGRIAQFTIEEAGDAVYWVREDGTLTYYNQAACDLLGYARAEMAGLTVYDIDRKYRPESWAAAWQRMVPGEKRVYEWWQQSKDGREIPVEISSNFVVLDGRGYNVSFVRDITDRRRADDDLRERESRLRQAQEIAHFASFERNLRSGELSLDGVERLLGLTTADLANRGAFLDRINPDDRTNLQAIMARTTRARVPFFRAIYRLRKPDGQERHVEELGRYTYDDSGEPIFLRGTIQDITDRRIAEQRLEFTQFALDSAAEAVFFLKRDASVSYVNDAACELLGYARDELLRMNVCDFNPSLLPEMIEARWNEVRRRHDEVDGGFVFETINQRKDGAIIDVEVAGRFIDYGGETYHLTFSRDITDRKRAQEALRESEAQLRLVANNLPALITYVDNTQRYRFVNRTCAQWYARRPEEIIGRTVAEIHGDEYERFRPHLERVLAGHRLSFETTGGYPDGTTRSVRCTYVPHRATDGEIEGFFALNEDVTGLKAREERLRQSQKMEAVGQLTGGIAHDFNNLMTIILGNLELLDAQLDDSQLSGRIEVASRAVKRGSDLTDKLLAFARRRALRPEHTDLNVSLAQHGDLLQRTLGEAIEIEMKLTNARCHTYVDVSELQTALLNLVINARDAMPRGGRLNVSTERVQLAGNVPVFGADAPRGQFIKVEVSDSGMGMSPEVLEHLFEPFYTTKEVGKGTGLGLSQVYGFVTQSLGYIAIESREGTGTRIAIYLPTVDAETTEMDDQETTPNARNGGSEKILVVEDNDEVRDVAVGMLSALGYEVISATDGNDALALMEQHDDIELLFTDVVMPGGYSGPELAARARRSRAELKVLYCSGYSEAVFAEHQVNEQEIDILAKPFSHLELAKRVREVLDAA